jgi:hypothetical protein
MMEQTTVITEKTIQAFEVCEKVSAEIKGQIQYLMDCQMIAAWKAYKLAGNELAISFKVKLKGDSRTCHIGTGISFTVEKITDEIEGDVGFTPNLFENNETPSPD